MMQALRSKLAIISLLCSSLAWAASEEESFKAAQTLALKKPWEMAGSIKDFPLREEKHRFEIARLIAERSPGAIVGIIKDFNLDLRHRFEIVRICLPGWETPLICRLSDYELGEEEKFWIAKSCAKAKPDLLWRHFERLNLDEPHRFQLFQESLLENIYPEEVLFEKFKVFDLNVRHRCEAALRLSLKDGGYKLLHHSEVFDLPDRAVVQVIKPALWGSDRSERLQTAIGSLMDFRLREINLILPQMLDGLDGSERAKLQSAIDSLPLIARFKKEHRQGVLGYHGEANQDPFLMNQLKYARACRDSALSVSPTWSLSEKFGVWVEDRTNWAKMSDNKDWMNYERRWIGYIFERDGMEHETGVMLTPIAGRYAFIKPSGVHEIFYEVGHHVYPLTQIAVHENMYKWFHTHAKTIFELEGHLEHLQDLVREAGDAMRSGINFQKYRRLFFTHLAHLYWLSCHILRTCRGNAQYCQNLLYHLLLAYDLPPLVAKRGLMVDCIAISITLEAFMRDFFTYFEPPDVIAEMMAKIDPSLIFFPSANPLEPLESVSSIGSSYEIGNPVAIQY